MENKAILEKINELEPEMLYKLLEVKAIQDSDFADAIRIAACGKTAVAAEEIKKEIASVKKIL